MNGNPHNSTVDTITTRTPDLPCERCENVVFALVRNTAVCTECGKHYDN